MRWTRTHSPIYRAYRLRRELTVLWTPLRFPHECMPLDSRHAAPNWAIYLLLISKCFRAGISQSRRGWHVKGSMQWFQWRGSMSEARKHVASAAWQRILLILASKFSNEIVGLNNTRREISSLLNLSWKQQNCACSECLFLQKKKKRSLWMLVNWTSSSTPGRAHVFRSF